MAILSCYKCCVIFVSKLSVGQLLSASCLVGELQVMPIIAHFLQFPELTHKEGQIPSS